MDTDRSVHPYYPPSARIPGYEADGRSVGAALPIFGGMVGAVATGAYVLAARSPFRLGPWDRFAAAWFALCGFLHVAFEGYYIFHRSEIAGMDTLFAQLWKEYSLSDSRYLTSDVFTVCVETITVFVWGPLSWLTTLAIVSNMTTRHVLQTIVCTAHLYGVALYYATNWTELHFHGVSYSRPEFLYFWIYYVGFNLPWAIVPLGLIFDSFRQVGRAFTTLLEVDKAAKAR
ncbi:hypothetical protein S40288_02242 [Stachybotrys chartarum IBT 40288]|nr:hypothetical protein S40288_02242 [Stachybotrys chartarum IBT 40288]